MGGSVTVRLNLNSTGYSAEMTKAQRQMQSFASATAAMGHGTVSQMQAASAAIRVVEGNMTNNIRAAERFISTIPGVGKALQAAFPLVGAIAFAGVAGELVKRVTEFVQKVQQAPQVISNSFREMNLSAETTIDTLNLSTAKMQEQIALLSGKRPNTLAEDLAEASLAADKLATSLDNDNRKIAEMLKANGLSALSGFLGKAGTADVAGSVNYFDQHMSDLGARHQHAVRSGDTAGAADLQKQLDDMRTAALNYANSQIGQRQQSQGPGALNQDANLAVLTGFRNALVDQGDQEQAEASNKATAAQLKKLDDAKKYADAQKKQQAELLKVYEDQEKQQNAFNKLTTNEEIQFWNDRISAFTKGGQAYLEVQDKIYDLIAKRPDLFSENRKNQADAAKSTVEGNDLMDRAQKALITTPATEQMERASKSLEKYNEMVAQSSALKTREAQAFQESSIAIALEQGTLSKLAAAQALAKVHADEHAAALRDVNKALADQISLINDPSTKMTPDDRANAIRNAKQEAGNQTDQINGAYAVTQQRDAANIYGDTIAGAAKNSLNEMVQSFTDMAATLKTVIPQTIEGLNNDIVRLATGQGKKGDFGHTLLGAGQGLVKTALQGIEGNALKAFHLGGKGGVKPDGTQNNRLYTYAIIEGSSAPGGGAPGNVPLPAGIVGSQLGRIPGFNGSALSDFIHPFIGGNPTVAGSSDAQRAAAAQSGGGSIFSKLLGAFLPGLHFGGGSTTTPTDDWGMPSGFQGGFAGGGDVLANRPMLVGELGPELLTPRNAAHVTPNHELGGGNTYHSYHIDARGATDPAAVHAAVARALPHAVAASIQAVHAQAKRSPSGR